MGTVEEEARTDKPERGGSAVRLPWIERVADSWLRGAIGVLGGRSADEERALLDAVLELAAAQRRAA